MNRPSRDWFLHDYFRILYPVRNALPQRKTNEYLKDATLSTRIFGRLVGIQHGRLKFHLFSTGKVASSFFNLADVVPDLDISEWVWSYEVSSMRRTIVISLVRTLPLFLHRFYPALPHFLGSYSLVSSYLLQIKLFWACVTFPFVHFLSLFSAPFSPWNAFLLRKFKFSCTPFFGFLFCFQFFNSFLSIWLFKSLS